MKTYLWAKSSQKFYSYLIIASMLDPKTTKSVVVDTVPSSLSPLPTMSIPDESSTSPTDSIAGYPEQNPDQDPENQHVQNAERQPENFSVFTKAEKRAMVAVGSLAAFFSPLSSSIYFPALDTIATALDVSTSKINITVTTYMVRAQLYFQLDFYG